MNRPFVHRSLPPGAQNSNLELFPHWFLCKVSAEITISVFQWIMTFYYQELSVTKHIHNRTMRIHTNNNNDDILPFAWKTVNKSKNHTVQRHWKYSIHHIIEQLWIIHNVGLCAQRSPVESKMDSSQPASDNEQVVAPCHPVVSMAQRPFDPEAIPYYTTC